jgi:hypothetical protein
LVIPQDFIFVCIYLVLIPPLLILRQLKHEKQLAELQEKDKKWLELEISKTREATETCKQEIEKIKSRKWRFDQ